MTLIRLVLAELYGKILVGTGYKEFGEEELKDVSIGRPVRTFPVKRREVGPQQK